MTQSNDPIEVGFHYIADLPSEYAMQVEAEIIRNMSYTDISGFPLIQKLWLRKTRAGHWQLLTNETMVIVWSSEYAVK